MDWVEVEGSTKAEAEAKAMKILGASSTEELELEELKVTRKFLGMGGKAFKLRARRKSEHPSEDNEELMSASEDLGGGVEVADQRRFDMEKAGSIHAYEVEPAEDKEEETEEEEPSATSLDDVEPAMEEESSIPEPPDGVVTLESRYRPWVAEGPSGIVVPRKGRGFGRRLFNPMPFSAAPTPKRGAPEIEEIDDDTREEEEFRGSDYSDVEGSPVSEETRRLAVDFIQQVLRDMGLEGDAKGFKLSDRLLVQIYTDSGGLLIGRKGETLESLQYLVDIIVNRKLEHRVRIVLDTENYRERRKMKIFHIAKKAAEDATRTRKSVALQPMNPAERRIVHMSLADDSRVETRSEGEGARRRVIIHPVGAKKTAPFKKGYSGGGSGSGGGGGSGGGYGGGGSGGGQRRRRR